ncbi:MAG: tRNA dihydrouridine synthase DusB [Deltaproteobacteria bacterium]|nr:tRNA dihydrouridine synthase DusB [Deltaproteobacteria bacterium]
MRIGTRDLPADGGHPDGSATGLFTAVAPMAAVTNPPFRALCREMGASFTVTEMVASEALVRGGAAGRNAMRMEKAPNEDTYAVQLFGADPDTMAEAARIAVEEGASIVDVNMGCPVRKIHGGGAGVALMKEPERAARIVRAMVDAVAVPVTAKIRAGWDDEHLNAPEVARALEDAGASLIAIHARTKEQVHAGSARLSIIAEVRRAVRVPVLGNGGVHTVADALRMRDETGCDGVMIGRGAHGNPWVFKSLREGRDYVPTLAERIDAMRRHLDLYVAYCAANARTPEEGESRAVREYRKHLSWYLHGLPGAAAVRASLPSLVTAASVHDLLDAYCAGLAARGLDHGRTASNAAA